MQRLICIFSLCMFLNACSDPMPQSGQASHTWSNGNQYVGEWKDGKPHGEGTATYVGLGQYVGTFKKGKRHGRGEASYVDGRKYVGEWKNGDPWQGKEYDKDGKVIAYYSGGSSSDGRESVDSSSSVTDALGRQVSGVIESVNDLFASESSSDVEKLRWDNGHEYIGQIKDGKYHGQGTYTWPNGQKYDGEWKGGKYDGQGTFTWADGRKYVGEWRDGKRRGSGIFTKKDWGRYDGEFNSDKPNGQGTRTFPDGNKYVGEWKNGKLHGQGVFTALNGNKEVGEFRSNALWHGVRYGNDGHVIGMMLSGVWKPTN